MPDKDQVFIYNDAELEVIKNTFAENDELLYAIRNVFFQFPLTDGQKVLIKNGVTPEVLNVLKKRILPDPAPEFPINQIPTILSTLTNDLKSRTVEDLIPLFEAKDIEIKYLEQQFKLLSGDAVVDENSIILSELSKIDLNNPIKTHSNLSAYLFILGYVDPMLGFIKSIAGNKGETIENQKKRMMRDSSK